MKQITGEEGPDFDDFEAAGRDRVDHFEEAIQDKADKIQSVIIANAKKGVAGWCTM